jgi:type IV pilus assembly protein PilZ
VQEKRSYQRVPIDLEVTIEIEGQTPFSALARDLSLGGMLIESEHTLAFGTSVTITTALPGEPRPVTLPAIVRWNKPNGFGVQFGLLGARETHAITNLTHK